MLKKLLVLGVSLCISQFAVADIATDVANNVSTQQATQNAKDSDVSAEDAVLALIAAGVNPIQAVNTVSNVYALTPAQKDSIITAAINALPAGTNTTPLVALYSPQGGRRLAYGPVGTQGVGGAGGGGGGTPVSPN